MSIRRCIGPSEVTWLVALDCIPNATGIAEDASGKVNPGTGSLTPIAGTGIFGVSADNGPATQATPGWKRDRWSYNTARWIRSQRKRKRIEECFGWLKTIATAAEGSASWNLQGGMDLHFRSRRV